MDDGRGVGYEEILIFFAEVRRKNIDPVRRDLPWTSDAVLMDCSGT